MDTMSTELINEMSVKELKKAHNALFKELPKKERRTTEQQDMLEYLQFKYKMKNKNKSYKKSETKQFIPISFENIDDYKFRVSHRSKLLLYFYMRRFIIREYRIGDRLDLYNRFYKNDKLVCSMSIRRLSNEFGYSSMSMIRKWISELCESSVIKTIKVKVNESEIQTVYVLGKIVSGEDAYFFDNCC